MKNKISKRILAGILTFGMAASLMPATAFAATDVDVTPGSGTLPVEYFSSTLYNWDENAANAATARVDYTDGIVYTRTTVRYNQVASQSANSYRSTNYWHRADDGEYYQVYYTRETSGYAWWQTTTYTLYYRNGNSYEEIGQTENGDATITLYTQSQGGYEGKGFYFTGADNKQNTPDFSDWAGYDQNYYIYSGLAEQNLSDSVNAPFSNGNVNAANLFATDGSNEEYTDVYTNVQVPFVYDEDTGYYELNSDKWAVYFDSGNAASNSTMTIADLPVSASIDAPKTPMCGFHPFEDVSSRTQQAYLGTSADDDVRTQAYTLTDGTPTYGFGMVTSVNFQMTDDGKDENGNPIEFSFSGDDDVWVYVDGVLALDIGGTHDAITGTIDFSTGDVTLTAEKYGKVGDKATDSSLSNPSQNSLSQTNLYTALGKTLTGFASEGQHTLTIYYMDRGRGATNCLIRFNLPQRDTVSVTKEITQSKTPDGEISDLTDEEQASMDGVDFGFTLYKDGEPVANTTYYVTKEGESGTRTAGTNAYGHFTLRNGETATFLDAIDNSTYYVVEDTLNADAYTTPEFTYSANAYNAAEAEETDGFQSMQVSAEGSATATDSINFVCKNYMNAELPNPSILPAEDRIVIDYGLPITISSERILSNDTSRGEEFEITSVTGGSYGTAVLSDDHSTITYTLNKQLNDIEELTYTAVARSGEYESDPATGTIKIIPATSMYYEEDFGSTTNTEDQISGGMIEYSGQTENQIVKWVQQGEALNENQETGYVGDDNDSTYGSDVLYLNNSGDSYGTSRYANADGAAGAAFEYDFTGTGTAIYGRTSLTTGYIEVVVTNTDTGAEADRQYINTRIIGDVSGDTVLYNIPIYNHDALDYGNYHVRVYLYKQGTPVNGYNDSEGNFVEGSDESGAEFYLDGIRVYEPLKGNETAESAYAADGEANVSIINIREKVVADDEEGYGDGEIFTLTDIDGEIMDVDTYSSIGPNEELYLDPGYNVSFKLVNWNSQLYNLYLGMKCPDGQSATVEVGGEEFEVNNSADCYYDISDLVVVEDGIGTVTISGVSGLVSLTNIKVTGDYEFDLGYAEDIVTYGLDENTLYLVPSNYSLSNDEDQEEDAPAFVPESIKTACSYGSKTLKATVTVLTSQDVSRVEINGTEVDPKTVNGKYKFTYSEKNVTAGTVFNIVLYNADGVASETYTVTAE